MKKIMAILVLILVSISVEAKPRGFYFEPTAKMSSIAQTFAYWAGFQAGVMLNQHFGIGAAFNSLTNRVSAEWVKVDYMGPFETLSIAYAGVVLSYTTADHSGWCAGFDLTIGDGWKGWEYASAPYYNYPAQRTRFLAIEPTLRAEANLARPLRITGGIGYFGARLEPEISGMMYSVGLKYLTL